jgi:hypothetical protein
MNTLEDHLMEYDGFVDDPRDTFKDIARNLQRINKDFIEKLNATQERLTKFIENELKNPEKIIEIPSKSPLHRTQIFLLSIIMIIIAFFAVYLMRNL